MSSGSRFASLLGEAVLLELALVSWTLGRLRAEGWLTTARQRIVLTDLPALRRRASEPA